MSPNVCDMTPRSIRVRREMANEASRRRCAPRSFEPEVFTSPQDHRFGPIVYTYVRGGVLFRSLSRKKLRADVLHFSFRYCAVFVLLVVGIAPGCRSAPPLRIPQDALTAPSDAPHAVAGDGATDVDNDEDDHDGATDEGAWREGLFTVSSPPGPRARVDVAGASFDVHFPAGASRSFMRTLEAWLRRCVRTVATATGGRFPHHEVQVFIHTAPRGAQADRDDDAVRFGVARWRHGASVAFLVDPDVTRAALEDDWVGVHELSHLLLLPSTPDARFVPEGFATYLQQTLRARCGWIAPERAFSEIADGFRRGRDITDPGRSLAEASARMGETRRFARVYWSGAAMMMEADLALRTPPPGVPASSLLEVVARAQRDVAAARGRQRSGLEIARLLDRHAPRPVFVPLYRRYARLHRFPDTATLRARLGGRAVGARPLDAHPTAAERRLRAALMQRDPRCEAAVNAEATRSRGDRGRAGGASAGAR